MTTNSLTREETKQLLVAIQEFESLGYFHSFAAEVTNA